MKTTILLLAVIHIGLSFAQEPAVVSVTPVCDVVTAVQCFGNMESVAQPHTITGNPTAEIFEPCQRQISEMSKLGTCLQLSLAGCDVIFNDAVALISQAAFFCNIVTNCTDFPKRYTQSLTCVTNMFVSITSGNAANSSKENCLNFTTCLNEKAVHCNALPMFLVDQWKLFEATCGLANVSRPAALDMQAAAPAPQMACPQLSDVTMKIFTCYRTFRDKVDVLNIMNVTLYCSYVREFETCVNVSVAVCPTASNFQSIFTASMQNYFKAINPICGADGVAPVCDTGHISACFANVDASMWKIQNNVVEGIYSGIDNTTDYTEIISRAKQMTVIAKDLGQMCLNSNTSITGTETCIAAQIAGCPFTFIKTFQANTNFLKNLCADFNGCTNFTAISSKLFQCSETARTQIQEHAKAQPIDQIAFRSGYCSSFNGLIKCMKAILVPCNTSSENILALYEMLAEDLEPICTDADFPELDNVTLSDDMEDFIDCRDLPEMSYELGKCHSEYLHQLASAPTQTENICMAITVWETCVQNVTEDCSDLRDEMMNLTDMARNALITDCPRPTTAPPIVTEPPTVVPNTTDSSGNTIDPNNNQTASANTLSINVASTTAFAVLVTNFIGFLF